MNNKMVFSVILFLFLVLFVVIDLLAINLAISEPKLESFVNQEYRMQTAVKEAIDQVDGTPIIKKIPEKNVDELNESYLKNAEYNTVEVAKDENQVYGLIVSLSDDQIIIDELLNLQCFYVFDYLLDEKNTLSFEGVDKKYNIKNLPWCGSLSGELYKETGKQISFDISSNATFLHWQDSLKGKNNSIKNYFYSSVYVPIDESEYGDLIMVTFDKSKTAVHIEALYTS